MASSYVLEGRLHSLSRWLEQTHDLLNNLDFLMTEFCKNKCNSLDSLAAQVQAITSVIEEAEYLCQDDLDREEEPKNQQKLRCIPSGRPEFSEGQDASDRT
jgi:hypothetical protein